MATKTKIDLSRLTTAMASARKTLERFRVERKEAVRSYVGSHWSEDGARDKVPINLISLYTQIVGRYLIAKNPRVMLATFNRQNKAMVAAMESWANDEIKHMKMAKTLARIALDGLFSIGIAKVALATPQDSSRMSWGIGAGAVFCERVDLDDFVFDVHARDFSEASFLGHRYRVPLDSIKDDKIYSKARKKLTASTSSRYNADGDEKISSLGRGDGYGSDEEFEDFVDLWEVFLPRHKLVLTLADDDVTGASELGEGEALREQEWLGPDSGPYHFLSFGVVPGNAMPKGPIQDLVDLHNLTNNIFRKLGRQAERQKQVATVQGAAVEDGGRVIESSDGDMIRVDNPDKIKIIDFGGVSQQSFAMFMASKGLFTELAGNLEMLGGLSAQSKTATQDKMLNENASGKVSDMQETTITFVAEVLEALCWYWHHDPFKVMKTTHKIPGMPDLSFERQVEPQQRQMVKFEDLKITVDPYSMTHSSPQARLTMLFQIVDRLAPMMQLLQQQGKTLDVDFLLSKIAHYGDMPDLAELFSVMEIPDQDSAGSGGGGGEEPGMPANTNREYTRHNVSEKTKPGQEASMVAQMMTGNDQGGAQQPSMAGA